MNPKKFDQIFTMLFLVALLQTGCVSHILEKSHQRQTQNYTQSKIDDFKDWIRNHPNSFVPTYNRCLEQIKNKNCDQLFDLAPSHLDCYKIEQSGFKPMCFEATMKKNPRIKLLSLDEACSFKNVFERISTRAISFCVSTYLTLVNPKISFSQQQSENSNYFQNRVVNSSRFQVLKGRNGVITGDYIKEINVPNGDASLIPPFKYEESLVSNKWWNVMDVYEFSLRSAGYLGMAYHLYPWYQHREGIGGYGISTGVIDFSNQIYHFDLAFSAAYMANITGGMGFRFGPQRKPNYHIHAGIGFLFAYLFAGIVSDLEKDHGIEVGLKFQYLQSSRLR